MNDDALEREKWEAEKAFREREIVVKERELATKEAELELQHRENASSQWRSPLVVAILAGSIAAIGTTTVAFINGRYAQQIESQQAEQSRILEVIKSGDPNKAAINLEFLLRANLINDTVTRANLTTFLGSRKGALLLSSLAGTVWATGGPEQRFYSHGQKFWVQALRLQVNGDRVYAIYQEGVGRAECGGREGPWLNIRLLNNGTQFFQIQNVETLRLPDAGTVAQQKIDVSDKVSAADVNAATNVEAFMPGDAGC